MNSSKNESQLCEMLQEVKNDFESIASIARRNAIHCVDVDNKIFKVYDYISKVIPSHRCVTLDENFNVVSSDCYLALLNDFEHVYSKIKELL